MVSNSSPPVKVDCPDSEADMTPYGGMELWLRSAIPSGPFRVLPAGIRREQGWMDGQMLLSLWLLFILGCDCAKDVDRLEADEGPCGPVGRDEVRILGCCAGRSSAATGTSGRFRRRIGSWTDFTRTTTTQRVESVRKGVAHVPVPSAAPLAEANRRLLPMAAEHAGRRRATPDVDATIVPSGRQEALFTHRAASRTHSRE